MYEYEQFKCRLAEYGDLTVFDKENDPNPDPEKRTGCSFDDFIALKNKKNIGEGIDKIIARLAESHDHQLCWWFAEAPLGHFPIPPKGGV